jgi:hypothetical protein
MRGRPAAHEPDQRAVAATSSRVNEPWRARVGDHTVETGTVSAGRRGPPDVLRRGRGKRPSSRRTTRTQPARLT